MRWKRAAQFTFNSDLQERAKDVQAPYRPPTQAEIESRLIQLIVKTYTDVLTY
jgi:hypothetical protein